MKYSLIKLLVASFMATMLALFLMAFVMPYITPFSKGSSGIQFIVLWAGIALIIKFDDSFVLPVTEQLLSWLKIKPK